MTSKGDRDHLFPVTSIGRTQGSGLQRTLSNDSLAAHPLLSPNHSSSPTTERGASPAPSPRNNCPPPSPHHQQGDATSKLQLVNLKAAAQNIGLDAGSVGWAILEKLVHESDHHDIEWTEVWAAVTSGKSTLLLPREQLSSHDKLTPEFVKDHIALCDGPSRKNAPIVTLSGLRGTLNNNTLTFRSTIHPSSKIFQDLLNPSSRPLALAILPDLPLTQPSSSSSVSYPSFAVPSHSSALPLPPRIPSPLSNKPPLPPRPGNRTASTSSTTSSTSRITNPFASLFGSGGSSSSSLHHTKPAAAVPPSPTASLRSLDSTIIQSEPIIDISAFTIERKIVRKDVGKEMNKALRREVKDALSDAGLPGWMIDRVNEFTAEWYPFVRDKGVSSSVLGLREKAAKEGGAGVYVVTWAEEAPESAAARMQDFYLGLEQEMRLSEGSFLSRLRKDHENVEEGERHNGVEDEKRVKEKIDSEAKIKEVMDVVEREVCSLFYDRLYMQPTSDDSSHDEALSSRVAALNMLDLGLEHLDIHVDQAGPELDAVVKACGDILSQLQVCRAPGDKAAVLVAAHKIIVDGLSRLPPIRLMSEEESKAQKAKGSAIARAKAEAPPREPDGTLRILMPMGSSASPTTDTMKSLEDSTSTVTESPLQTEDDVDLATPHAPTSQRSPIPIIVEPKLDTSSPEPASESHPVEPASPVLKVSTPQAEATPVSGDVLLPMVIFAVVRANPPRLVSNLLYTQRYRNQSVGGEESYCLINLMAVAEFLENVDLAALGLGDSDKVLSAADLTPIPLNRSPITAATPLATIDGVPGSLRDRVEQANKVITGVVDSSFGMLRSLLPTNSAPVAPLTPPVDGVQSSAPWNAVKPGIGLLRRESGFSIRSITAALPMNRGAARAGGEEETGQQLVTVSRPSSVRSALRGKGDVEEQESGTEDESAAETGTEDEEAEDEEGGEGGNDDASAIGDARSIRSFESMMNGKGKKDRLGLRTRKSLTDRLAHMSSLAGLKANASQSQAGALVPPGARPHSPASSRPHTPDGHALHLAPPVQRFMECSVGDLRLSEVGELLRDYRRLVEGIRAVRGFDE